MDDIDISQIRFGRRPEFDEHSRAYGIAERIGAAAIRSPRTYQWPIPAPAPLDQGYTSECVAFTWTHELIAAPIDATGLGAADAHRWYRRMQRIDGIPDDQDGTSVLAGAKVMRTTGNITSYRWAFNEQQVAAAVAWHGPVVLGLPWTEKMMTPTRGGFLIPDGPVLGGHAVLCFGVDIDGDHYWIMSSWGPRWGSNGRAKIGRGVLSELLAEQGEACVPVRDTPPAPASAS